MLDGVRQQASENLIASHGGWTSESQVMKKETKHVRGHKITF